MKPDRMKATGRVNRPNRMRTPPTNSSTPAAPRRDTNCRLSKYATCGKPKNFAVPCCRNSNAIMMRSTDSRRGDQVWWSLSIDAASVVTDLSPTGPGPRPHLGAIQEFIQPKRPPPCPWAAPRRGSRPQLRGNGAGREPPVRDFRYRRHLGGAAGDEALREARELVRHDAALDHVDAVSFGELDRGLPGDAVEEAVGD